MGDFVRTKGVTIITMRNKFLFVNQNKEGHTMPQHFQNRTPEERMYILEEQMMKVQKMLQPNGFIENKVVEYERRIAALEEEIKALKK